MRAIQRAGVVGTLAALLFAPNLIANTFLTPIAPALGGIVAGFTVFFALALASLFTNRWGVVTATFTLYCTAAVPTLIIGPPGVYKIILGLAAGFATDTVMRFGPRKYFINLILGPLAFSAVFIVTFLYLFRAFDIPGYDKFLTVLPFVAAIFIVEGTISCIFAGQLYERRLKKIPWIAKLREPTS